MYPSEYDTEPSCLTVLFAEDDPLLRELMCAKLRAQRYRVIEAGSGDEALALLHQGAVDVLLTDISMPGTLDGWSLAEHARTLYPRIAVVYSSSRPADAPRQLLSSLYFRKPYHPDDIVAAIRQLTSG